MLEELKERVCKTYLKLHESGLDKLTWSNVSAIDRSSGLIVIKPSGLLHDELTSDKMVVINMEGMVVEGTLRPSSDAATHIALYQGFEELGAIVHTHSKYATVWAQAGLDIVAYGTTHADYFYGDIPCTLPLEEGMIAEDYEKNTGFAILDTFARRNLSPMEVPACLVAQHGPFTWGATPEEALENALVLEEVANMAVYNANFQFGLTRISDALLDKHYLRKHGENAYYGQTFGSVQALDPEALAAAEKMKDDIVIAPSSHTVELKNISEIDTVAPPVINRPPKKEEKVFNFEDKIPEDNTADDMSSGMEPIENDMGFSPPPPPARPVQPTAPMASPPPVRPMQPAAPMASPPPMRPVQPSAPTAPPPPPKKPDPPSAPLDFTF